jgi:hypothetical protein
VRKRFLACLIVIVALMAFPALSIRGEVPVSRSSTASQGRESQLIPKKAERKASEAKAGYEDRRGDGAAPKGWTDLLLAIFTGVLAGSTILLWIEAGKQRKELKRLIAVAIDSAAATGKTAEAARKSADALPRVERGYLIIRGIDVSGRQASINLLNVGKTAAIVKEVRVQVVPKRSPCPEDIENTFPVNISKDVQMSGEANTLVARLQCEPSYPMRDLILYGLIKYEDVFEDTSVLRFCWHHDSTESTTAFHRCSNMGVNYRKTEEKLLYMPE